MSNARTLADELLAALQTRGIRALKLEERAPASAAAVLLHLSLDDYLVLDDAFQPGGTRVLWETRGTAEPPAINARWNVPPDNADLIAEDLAIFFPSRLS